MAGRYGQDNLLKFTRRIRIGKKGDSSDFEHGVVIGARWADG